MLCFYVDRFLNVDWLIWPIISLTLACLGVFIGKIILKLDSLAQIEPRTNLYNRRHFNIVLERELDRKKHTHVSFCIAMVDVDNFKKVNDRYGHVIGDKVLSALSQILKENTRSIDILCRWGGDEFALLLPHTDETTAINVCERIRKSVEQNSKILYGSTVSIGIVCSLELTNQEQIINLADEALYEAKTIKNKIFFSNRTENEDTLVSF